MRRASIRTLLRNWLRYKKLLCIERISRKWRFDDFNVPYDPEDTSKWRAAKTRLESKAWRDIAFVMKAKEKQLIEFEKGLEK